MVELAAITTLMVVLLLADAMLWRSDSLWKPLSVTFSSTKGLQAPGYSCPGVPQV